MNRNTVILIIFAAIVLAGVGIWQFVFTETPQIVEQSGLERQPAEDALPIIERDLNDLDLGEADFRDIDTDLDALGATEVLIEEAGFSPKNVVIKAGETVVFSNRSSRESWPASAVHPTHTAYPGSDAKKCDTSEAGGIFDACRGLKAGETWSFTFAEKGTWRYHDHLNPNFTGSITVE